MEVETLATPDDEQPTDGQIEEMADDFKMWVRMWTFRMAKAIHVSDHGVMSGDPQTIRELYADLQALNEDALRYALTTALIDLAKRERENPRSFLQ
jgi:hypothetical protein